MRTDSWQALGFFCAPDHEHRAWRFDGTRIGLARLQRLLIEAANTLTSGSRVVLGPNSDVRIRVWERPGIDDETIYGNPEDLKRLARMIESKLADATPTSEFRIGTDYAHDAEYAMVVRVMDDDFDVAAATAALTQNAREPEQGVDEPETPPIPFSFYDPEWELEGGEGLFRVTEGVIWLQHQLRDDDETLLPEVHEHIIPLEDVAAVTYKRGIIGPLVKIQTYDMRLLEGIPTARTGQISLRFKRRNREEVERVVAYIEAQT